MHRHNHGHQQGTHDHAHPSTTPAQNQTTVVVRNPVVATNPYSFHYHGHQQPYFIPQQHTNHLPYHSHHHDHDEHGHNHTHKP